jgi:hypothetical protein
MSSIWNNSNGGADEEGMTEQIRTALGNNGAENRAVRPVEAYRTSKPPLNDAERKVYAIFDKLRSKTYNLIQKREIAEAVLRGDYGTKHALNARLLLGPKDLQEIIDYPMDIVLPILELIDDRDQRVREKIAAVLAVRGDEGAIDAMCTKLDSDNYSERHEFGMALGKMTKNISNVEALQTIHSEVKKRMEAKNEFSSAWRYVRRRLRELGAVIPKPEMKRVVAPKMRSENVTAPLELTKIMIKPEGKSGDPGRSGDMTIPFVRKR